MYVLIVVNESNAAASEASLILQTYLTSQQIDCLAISSSKLPGTLALDEEGTPVNPFFAAEHETDRFDLAVALGGDGTILRTARAVYGSQTPVMGINFGHLGFLANPSEIGVVPLVAAALAGEAREERRSTIVLDIECEGDNTGGQSAAEDDTDELNTEPRRYFALNEVALTRGVSGRIVNFKVSIAAEKLADLRGDGVVVSTATGSTAYALSAGGPCVAPSFRGLVVVPLAVHTLQTRPLVTEHSDVVEIELANDGRSADMQLFADGEPLAFTRPLRRLAVHSSDMPVTLLRYRDPGFYHRLARVFF